MYVYVYINILIQTLENTSALHLFFLVHFFNSFKLWLLCYINKDSLTLFFPEIFNLKAPCTSLG